MRRFSFFSSVLLVLLLVAAVAFGILATKRYQEGRAGEPVNDWMDRTFTSNDVAELTQRFATGRFRVEQLGMFDKLELRVSHPKADLSHVVGIEDSLGLAADALMSLGTNAAAAVGAIIPLTKATNEMQRRYAFDILIKIAPESDEVLRSFCERLEDSNPEVAWDARSALVELHAVNEKVCGAMARLIEKEPAGTSAEGAGWVLLMSRCEDPEIVPAVNAMLATGEPKVEGVARALLGLQDTNASPNKDAWERSPDRSGFEREHSRSPRADRELVSP